MTNFNGLSPWVNMLNYLNTVKLNQSNSVNIQQNAAQNIAQTQPNPQIFQNLSDSAVNVSIPSVISEAQQANLQEVLKMNNEVVQKYLQSLLNMPENIDKIINALNTKDINSQSYQFLKIFVENMLSNKELNQLLNQNSNEAIQKLLNVISQSLKYNSNDTSQLREILSVLNTIHSSSSLNTNTLRELFLLYIPIDYQVFKQDSNFKKIEEENEDKIKNSILSIMLETVNFSNILAILNYENNSVILQLCTSKDFPYDKFKKGVSEFSKENSINILYDFMEIHNAENYGKKQNFKVISQDYIPVNIINVSYFIIKSIFRIDSEFSQLS